MTVGLRCVVVRLRHARTVGSNGNVTSDRCREAVGDVCGGVAQPSSAAVVEDATYCNNDEFSDRTSM